MPRLMVFNSITLDGYFTGENGDLGWAHSAASQDAEWQAFVAGNAKGGGLLVFGRKTYEMMAGYWPTPEARRDNPEVAKQMNALPKVVFSTTMDSADWNNTRLVKADPASEITRLKRTPGPVMVIFGSGTIVSQLAQEGLIDEYQFVIVPVALGKGRTMFEGVSKPLSMKPTQTRSFRNGNVLLCYEPVAPERSGRAGEPGEAQARPVTAG
jgi:dihydrofolate reductase